jgi:CheY-like chemotaxis protein
MENERKPVDADASATTRPDVTHRILVVDDNADVRSDFERILRPRANDGALDRIEAELFGGCSHVAPLSVPEFQLELAAQGREAHERVVSAVQCRRPFSLAFVDMRMPPGWDGLETTQRLWSEDPNLPIVLCTAYSDYSWSQMSERLARVDRWLLLRKPFDPAEVVQMACALSERAGRAAQTRRQLSLLVALLDRQAGALGRAMRELGAKLHG